MYSNCHVSFCIGNYRASGGQFKNAPLISVFSMHFRTDFDRKWNGSIFENNIIRTQLLSEFHDACDFTSSFYSAFDILLSIAPCYNNKEQVPVIFLKVKENVPVQKNKGHY